MKKKHYATRLKEEKAQILADLYSIIDGSFEIETKYRVLRKYIIDHEKLMWLGETSVKQKL